MSDAAATAMTGSSLSVILIDIALLGMMAMTAIAIARLRSLFAIVMLSGVYSLFSAAWFVVVDAVDVAFTEAAVGAGISTALILGGMLLTVRTAKQDDRVLKRFAPFLVCLVTGAVLVYATIDLPGFGEPNSPANIYLAKEYMERNTGDIGIPNVVTSILASYRGFDTFGETGVVFIAGLAVALLIGFGERSLAASLRNGKKPASTLAPDTSTGDHHVILRVMAKMLIPIIIMYAFYVQFHGDYSPGGGFQAGVIFAVGIILYALIFGVVAALTHVTARFARYLALAGFILYGSVGIYAMLNGGNFLDYDFIVAEGPEGHHGQHYGILGVELGVLFAVAGSMLTIFYAFAGRAPDIEDEDW